MGHNYTLPNGHVLRPRQITAYSRDCKVEYWGHANNSEPVKRTEVVEFTDKSRARLAFVAHNTQVDFLGLATMTYPKQFPSDGKLVKSHLRALLMRLKRRFPGVDYLWFIEWQKRGAPHFHILTDISPGASDRTWLSLSWYEIVGSDDPKHLAAGTNWERVKLPDGLRHYVVKYAHKMRQKRVPPEYLNVGRFWGHSKRVKPQPVATPIQVTGVDDLKHKLRTWDYVDALDKPLSTLYNASYDVLVQQLLDKTGS